MSEPLETLESQLPLPLLPLALPALLAPLACATAGVGCADAKTSFPPYHPLAVCCVATGAYLLAKVAAASAATAAAKKDDDARVVAGLPAGAWMILFNCCVYAVTSRLDKAATLAAGTLMGTRSPSFRPPGAQSAKVTVQA